MLKTISALPLLLALGLSTAPQASALTLENGLTLNGLTLNGLSANGLTINGLTINGLATNGLSANGVSFTGTDQEARYAMTIILRDGEHVTLD